MTLWDEIADITDKITECDDVDQLKDARQAVQELIETLEARIEDLYEHKF